MVFGLSSRYCVRCKKDTIWQYDKILKHSRCNRCRSDSRMSRNPMKRR